MLSWHVTWASKGRRPLAPEETNRRELVRTIARVAGGAVSLFCVVDDHVHVVLYCPAEERGRYVQALSLALAPRVPIPLGAAFVQPVEDRHHMEWLANEYILRQPVKHGLSTHPALWTGSCFPDLVGARLLPGLDLCLEKALPRWRQRAAYRAVGLPTVKLAPAADDSVRRLGAARIVSAAASAMGVPQSSTARGDGEVASRRCAAVLASGVGIRTAEIAWALGVTPQATNRLVDRAVPPKHLRATRLRLALEEAAAAHPYVDREAPPDDPFEHD
jgi:hypothetical protein